MLSGSAAGFTPALPGYSFRFPRDAGAHPDYRNEWWYYTGHLRGSGHEFGFELTFFRVALSPHPPKRLSRWATNQVYLAHFALTNVSRKQFAYSERLERGALGLAGAAEGFEDVHVDNWRALSARIGHRRPALWSHQLQASAPFGAISLVLTPEKPPIIEGQNGVSLKGPGIGQASHYYSYTRLKALGIVRWRGERVKAQGEAWMDHEISSGPLPPDVVGWDWFSVQLSDGWDVMLYRLRSGQGRATPFSSGTLIDPNGKSLFLSSASFSVQPEGGWTSPHSNAHYPSSWTADLPGAKLHLRIVPLVADQELVDEAAANQSAEFGTGGSDTESPTVRIGPTYWEGASRVEGTHLGAPVSGEAYVELTGYALKLS